MSFQKALVVKSIGQPLVLVNDRPIPQPGPDQVQMRVSVTGLNPHDRKFRDLGMMITKDLPAVLANDVVGKVTQIGANVTSYAVGDRIVSQGATSPGTPQTGLQEYAVADIWASTKIPDSISDDEAATLPSNIMAPVVALFDTLKIPPPWTEQEGGFDYANTVLLIVGGGSNCGKFGVQLAKLAGIGKIVVVGGNEEQLKSYGATHVISRYGGNSTILENIKAIVGDDLVYAFDSVNDPDGLLLTANALSSHKKGSVARLLPLGPIDDSKVLGKSAGYEILNVFGSSHAKPKLAESFWKVVPQYLQDGKIKPLDFVAKEGLDPLAVNEVLDSYRDGKTTKKTHIHLLT